MDQPGWPNEESADAANAHRPLDGVRVIDLSRLVAGNAISHVLADFGAEIIKIEHPIRGDDLRRWLVDGIPTYWKVYSRGKKSVTLDYRQPEGHRLLLELIGRAEVLIENFVPGGLEKYGLSPETLHEINPKLVIARVSGWGQSGPYKGRPGFGTLVEAMSGFAALNGFPDRPPTLPPLALADMICGLYGVGAVLMALREVEVNGGKGQIVDLSLFDSIFSILGPEAANYRITGKTTPRLGSRSATSSPRNVYPTNDGKFVALSASMQSMAERLFRVIGRADLIDDPRFATNSDRLAHAEEIDSIIAEFMGARSQAENLAIFEEAGVTVGPVCDIADLMDHPFIKGREVLVDIEDAEMGQIPMHNVVARLSGTPGRIAAPAPDLGAHNDEILAEIGLDESDLTRLREAGIIR
ncbi:CaiB/BaiF CoA transferase family protein [Acuticoccus kandeliae]|uniref:CaiB/BaiF CoA transferase family protein n=1 Tax=Acuticoccus kandeliae TaxID=2073160 RepID=UPI000D3E65B1|nr:CoA transferase [Acuticoccus kandeliae]